MEQGMSNNQMQGGMQSSGQVPPPPPASPPPPPPSKAPKGEGMKLSPAAAIGILVVIIIIAAGLYYWFFMQGGSLGDMNLKEIEPGQNLITAANGRIVSGFPRELILEDDPDVVDSYEIEYLNDNVSQPVVQYTSALTLEENIDGYRRLLIENEWRIIRDVGPEDALPTAFLYAFKDNAEVNITLIQVPGGVSVNIAYAKKTE